MVWLALSYRLWHGPPALIVSVAVRFMRRRERLLAHFCKQKDL